MYNCNYADNYGSYRFETNSSVQVIFYVIRDFFEK